MTAAQKTELTTESVHRLHGARPGAGNALAVSDSMEAMLANATAWQRGTMEFVASRLAKDSDAMRKLVGCTDPDGSGRGLFALGPGDRPGLQRRSGAAR